MNLVLAIEPDSSQADPLSSVIREELGAELVHVTSTYAAIVAVNRAMPDLVLFGQSVVPAQRARVLAHIESREGSSGVHTLDIPRLDSAEPAARSGSENPNRSFVDEIATCLTGSSAPPSAPSPKTGRRPIDPSLMQALAAEVEEAQREAEFAAAREATRIKAEAVAAIEEARQAADAEVTRRALEDEIGRVKASAEAQVQAAMARAREDSEHQIREQVALARTETEARLEAQLADVRGEAEQVRQAHQQAVLEADRIRVEAATAAREAAEVALASEIERIRAEAQSHLEAEVAALREKAERPQDANAGGTPTASVPAVAPPWWALPWIPRVRWDLVRWDLAGAAVAFLTVTVASAIWLPRILGPQSSSAVTTDASLAADVATVSSKGATPKTEQARRPRPVRAPSKPAPPPPAAEIKYVGSGFLAAFSSLPMELYADGRRIGTTEDGQILLPPGRHTIEFVSRRFNYQATASVTILPGKTTAHTVTLPMGQLHVYTTAGSEVWIDGERAGVAPLNVLEIPIGTRDVLVRDGSGERRQTVEVRYGETSQVTITPVPDINAPRPVPHLAPLSQYQTR